ncbi:MAG: hypothetical protein RJA36_3808 [Pseudomonadota bacterium]|jgi:hypothetical protein
METASESLSPATETYLRSVPKLKYPSALVTAYPRIANQIVALSSDVEALKTYFDSLTSDLRGGRHGFPFDVLMDIHALRDAIVGDQTGFVVDDRNKWVS